MILGIQFTPVLPPPDVLAQMGWRIGIAIVVAFLVQRALFLIWGRLPGLLARAAPENAQAHATQRGETIKYILRNVTTVTLLVVVVIRALDVMGWDVKPLLAGAGILGVALGFGAQALVRDWIAGIYILIEDQFAVGDTIEVNGQPGTVEALTVRATQLRDFNGFLHFVPNGEMRIVVNRSREWNRAAVDIPVRAGQNLDRALEICREAARTMSEDSNWAPSLLEPIVVLGIERLAADGAVMRLVLRTRPGEEGSAAARELRRRVHDALAAGGIEYPATAISVASPNAGPTPQT